MISQVVRIDPKTTWRRYVVALCIMLTLYSGGHLYSMSATSHVNSESTVGLLMSRQEALSQRILIASQRILNGEDGTNIRSNLGFLLDEFDAAHTEILNGGGDTAMMPINSERLRPIFFEEDLAGGPLNEKVSLFSQEVRKIQLSSAGDANTFHDLIATLRDLRLYDKLESATEAFQLDSKDRDHRLHMIQLVILIAGILTILFEACLIFWPAHVAIRDSIGTLENKSTELEVANAQLQNSLLVAEVARREADRSNGAKSMFLANMSHELRTPLNAIIGFSSMIEAETFGPVGNERYKGYAGDIERSGTHLLDLIGDLMDISQVEVGAAQLEPKDVAISDLFDGVRSITNGWPMARNRSIRFIEGPDVGTYYGDPLRLRQIILNLLSNSIKFTQGHAQIFVMAHNDKAGNLEIVVEDTGKGFDLDKIESLMEPFQRGDDALTRSREGTGLGLSLVGSFVKMHGGSVSYGNGETGGARVIVTLPPKVISTGSLSVAA